MTLAEDTAALGLSPGMFDSVAHIPAVVNIVHAGAAVIPVKVVIRNIIDFASTTAVLLGDGSIDVTLAWLPVAGATSYKVFYNDGKDSVYLTTENQPVKSSTTNSIFTNESGPLTATTVTLNIPSDGNFWVYSYVNAIRGDLPATHVYVEKNFSIPNKIEVWPTVTVTPGGIHPHLATITCTNLYTGESVTLSPAQQAEPENINVPQLPIIHGNVPLQSKTF